MIRGWPQAKEKDDDNVDDSEAVRHGAKDTVNTPGAPREFFTGEVGENVSRARVELDITA